MSNFALNVDTGSVSVPIYDKGEKIGEFRFNPSDLDIAKRYKAAVKKLQGLNVSEKASTEELIDVSEQIKQIFDELFNYNVSEAIFAKANPLTPLTDGSLYCMTVMSGLQQIIEQAMTERTRKAEEKINRAVEDIIDNE